MAFMQRPASSTKGEVKPSISNATNEATHAASRVEERQPLEPVAERAHRISVGTEELADEDRRYSNVACTD